MELRKDILNISSHIFGEHKRCKKRDHKCEDDCVMKKNYISLKLHGFYPKIEAAVTYLAAHSDSFLLNVTNNLTELFNLIICKEIDRKRINFDTNAALTMLELREPFYNTICKKLLHMKA